MPPRVERHDAPGERRAVHVDVEDREEDRDAQALAALLVLDRVDGEHAAVGRRDDGAVVARARARAGLRKNATTKSRERAEQRGEPADAERERERR